MKLIRYTILLTFLLINIGSAQELQTQRLTISEGLSHTRVHDIYQDSYGLLWVLTNDGLNIYDGYSFKIFKNVPGNPKSIGSNICWSADEDADGNIWIGTEVGVSKYIREKNEFINYEIEEIFGNRSGSNGRVLSVMIDSEGDIWAGTIGLDIIRFDKENDTWIQPKLLAADTTASIVQSNVMPIIEDKNKTIWIGSFGHGLMWYDRDEDVFKTAEFSKDSSVPSFSTTEDYPTFLYSDPTGVLWLTTRNGIYKYYPDSKYLKRLVTYSINRYSFWNFFNSITQDVEGNIWIANNQRGILKFDGISDEFETVKLSGQNFNNEGLSDIVLTQIQLDKTGILWIGSITDGLIKHDPQRAPFLHFTHDEKNPGSVSGNQIFGLFESRIREGKIFVGTRGGGLNLFDMNTQKFSEIPFEVFSDDFGGSVRGILEEENGTLWLGTWGDGLIKMNRDFKVRQRFVTDSSNSNSLSDNLVRVIKKGPDGKIWIGTNHGLCYYNPFKNEITRVTNRRFAVYPNDLHEIVRSKFDGNHNLVIDDVGNYKDLTLDFEIIRPRYYLVASTGEGIITDSLMYDYGWISTDSDEVVWSAGKSNESYHMGGAFKNRIKIDIIHLKPGKYKLRYKSDDSHCFADWNAEPPTYTNLWGIGIKELDDNSESDLVQQYLDTARRQRFIDGSNIRSIHITRDNVIWIGSDAEGLNRYDWTKQTIKTYSFDPEQENGLSDNSIPYIHEDKDGILWLGTNNGLNRFDPEKETFTVFTEEDGLPTNYIATILPGEGKNLWLATRNGISKMIPDLSTGKTTFVNYDLSDGLGGTDFIALVGLKSSNGQYFFGGEHGLNAFTPGKINRNPPSLIFSDLEISNKSVFSMKNDSPLETSLYDLDYLELDHDNNDLSFEFAALHFSNPQKNQYAHMLQGYDKDWIYDNKRNATYTNLDPGDYTFVFKGSNRDGLWYDGGKSLNIKIYPPWWQTIWAYIGYGLILILGILALDRIQRRRLLNKAKERMRLQEAEHRAEAAELQAQAAEAQAKIIQVENERKTKELEEARQLQLSMLPKQLPQLPNLDIAVYMKTATEVGGDYYDFHVSLDGTLTVVIGDATGHGMKAGTMVTTAKSLFNSYAPNPDILFSFQEITRCIKQMNFDHLSMCLTMLKIQGNKITMSAAGMPPSFIYRRETQSTEEHLLKGMPLGTMDNFPYQIKDTTLQPGDTILMISDGLPELKNNKDEMFGYKGVRNTFEEVAEKSPEEIIKHLKDQGSEWVADEDPEDDVTFVVIKVK